MKLKTIVLHFLLLKYTKEFGEFYLETVELGTSVWMLNQSKFFQCYNIKNSDKMCNFLNERCHFYSKTTLQNIKKQSRHSFKARV